MTNDPVRVLLGLVPLRLCWPLDLLAGLNRLNKAILLSDLW